MALLTATELKASREAIEAGVSTVSDAAANAAISEAEAFVYQILGYQIEVSETSFDILGQSGSSLVLPQRAKTITLVTEDGGTLESSVYVLRGDGWLLRRPYSSWRGNTSLVVTGTFGFAAGHTTRTVATQAVRLLAVYALEASKDSNFPSGPPGSVVTGYSNDGGQSTDYFTPIGEKTGYANVDRLLDSIAHPYQKGNGLFTLSTGRGYSDITTFDDIIAGRALE